MFNASLPSELKKSPFITPEVVDSTFPTYNLIVIGPASYFQKYITEKCNQEPGTDLWRCGELRLFHLAKYAATQSLDVEEMEIRITGQRPFGADMFPSGPISSYFLGRKFGRDYSEATHKPHAVLMDDDQETRHENVSKVRQLCQNNGIPMYTISKRDIPKIADEVNAIVQRKIIMQAIKKDQNAAYERGYKKGRADAEAAHVLTSDIITRQTYLQGFKHGYNAGVNQRLESMTKKRNPETGQMEYVPEDHGIQTPVSEDEWFRRSREFGHKPTKGTKQEYYL